MSVTLTIQKGDTSEDRGIVTREQAIQLFQDYPWQETYDTAMKEVVPVFPVMVFSSATHGELRVSGDGSDFQLLLTKDNKEGEEFVSANIGSNSSGTTPEDFIAAFYDGDLHEHLDMQDVARDSSEERPEKMLNYSFSRKSRVQFMTAPALLLLLAGWLVKEFLQGKRPDELFLVVYGLMMLACIPFTVLFFNYYRHDRNRNVTVARDKKEVTIEQNGASVSFNVNDVEACRIFSGKKSYFSFILFKLKNGKHYSVTNFTADPSAIAEALRIRTEDVDDLFPWVPADSPF